MECNLHHQKHEQHIDIPVPEDRHEIVRVEVPIPPPHPIKKTVVKVIKQVTPPCKVCEIPKKHLKKIPEIRNKEPVGKTLVERSYKVGLNSREYEDYAWRNYAYMLNAQDVTPDYIHKADSTENYHVDGCGHHEEMER